MWHRPEAVILTFIRHGCIRRCKHTVMRDLETVQEKTFALL